MSMMMRGVDVWLWILVSFMAAELMARVVVVLRVVVVCMEKGVLAWRLIAIGWRNEEHGETMQNKARMALLQVGERRKIMVWF